MANARRLNIMNLGTSGGFWLYAAIIAVGMAILFGGIVFYFSNKRKGQ